MPQDFPEGVSICSTSRLEIIDDQTPCCEGGHVWGLDVLRIFNFDQLTSDSPNHFILIAYFKLNTCIHTFPTTVCYLIYIHTMILYPSSPMSIQWYPQCLEFSCCHTHLPSHVCSINDELEGTAVRPSSRIRIEVLNFRIASDYCDRSSSLDDGDDHRTSADPSRLCTSDLYCGFK